MVVRPTMDFFQHRYYRTSKTLMKSIGQWPDQGIRINRCVGAVIVLFVSTLNIPVAMAAIEYRDDRSILVDCLAGLSLIGGCGLRILTFLFNSKEITTMLHRIRTDWLVWAGEEQVNTLHQYADQGRKITITYSVAFYTFGYLYTMQPILPKIIDIVLYNGSEPGHFPLPIYYFNIDLQQYYFYNITYMFICFNAIFMVEISFDTMFFVYVQHACGIFATVGQKLEQIGKDASLKETEETACSSEHKDEDSDHAIISSCIARHNDAIEYVNLIEKTYTWTFFIITIFRIAMLSLILLQIVTRIDKPEETTRYLGMAMALIMYCFVESYVSQILADHSIAIHYHIQNGQWYNLSLKNQKLMQFMMMRCTIPCQLTAGKIMNISLASFAMFMKTSVSYLTVLRSV